MSSAFYSSHKGFMYQKKRKSTKEICYVCKRKYWRTSKWNNKFCEKCESVYRKHN
jgi:hypothetical protein